MRGLSSVFVDDTALDDAGGNPDNRGSLRHVPDDDGVRAHARPVANRDGAEDPGAATDIHVVAQTRILISLGADRDLMFQTDIRPAARLPVNHNPLRMQQDEPRAEFGATANDARTTDAVDLV